MHPFQLQPRAPGKSPELGLLLGITDDELAPAIVAVTHSLQKQRNARPSVLYVIEVRPSAPETAAVAVVLEEELSDPRIRERREREMRAVLKIDQGAPAEWPFTIEIGGVAATIVEQAQRDATDLIVMGLNRHTAVGRAFGNDTVREVMTSGSVPVLAVRPQLTSLPNRVVVAVDFSRASVRAAHLARRLVDDHGSMHLLFVESTIANDASESAEGLRLIQAKGLQGAFKQLISELDPSAGMTIDTVVRQGGPVQEITRYCAEIEADLVAIGSQRHRFLDRLLLGSVAKSIAADGRWSTLVTPPAEDTRA